MRCINSLNSNLSDKALSARLHTLQKDFAMWNRELALSPILATYFGAWPATLGRHTPVFGGVYHFKLNQLGTTDYVKE